MNLPGIYTFDYHGVCRTAILIRRDGITDLITAWEVLRDGVASDGYKTYRPDAIRAIAEPSWDVTPMIPAHVIDHFALEGIDLSAFCTSDKIGDPELADLLYGGPSVCPIPPESWEPVRAPSNEQAMAALGRSAVWINGSVAHQPWAVTVNEQIDENPSRLPEPGKLTRFYVVSYTGLSVNFLLGPYVTWEEAATKHAARAEYFRGKTPELDAGTIGVLGMPATPSLPVSRYGQ